jgi:hypothetical protein
LLGGLGMKPADIEKVLATAEANAKKAASAPNAGRPVADDGSGDPNGGGRGRRNNGGGGRGGDGAAGQQMGRGQGQDQQGRGQGAQGGSGGGRFGSMSDEDRQKMMQIRQQMQAATTDEDRAKFQKQMQDLMAKNGMTGGPGGQGRGGDGAAGQGRGQGGPGGGRRGDGQSGGRGANNGLPDPLAMIMARGRGGSPYSEEDRKNAKLPLPPGQDSQIPVLLRPGLLADVEIEVEKIPNVLHVPAQAVFNKNGKYTVFVQGKDKKFAPREVQLVKQSESMMVLAGGVEPGEVIAMADPTVKKSDSKADKKGASGNPMGGMPGGK